MNKNLSVHVPAVVLMLLVVAVLPAWSAPADQARAGFTACPNDRVNWHNLYWSWIYGQTSLPTDGNGNAVQGNTALLALPNVPGDGTPGSINITLEAGQWFFLPLIGVLGTSYTDGTPPDPFVDLSIFEDMTVLLTLDGTTVVDEANVMDFYEQGYFSPGIPVNSPPLDDIIYFQSLGLLHPPLPPGEHVIQLDEVQSVPVFGYTAEYHNTFNITVRARGH
jgi:hypothetical protein